MTECVRIPLIVQPQNDVSLTISADPSVALQTAIGIYIDNLPEYEGEYVFTPTQETQTALTKGYKLTDNITINPIPSNYGLITWDGSSLMVS